MAYYAVSNEADLNAALQAGIPRSQIVYAGSNPSASQATATNGYATPTGLGTAPAGAEVVYVGQAAKIAPGGSQTIAGADRNQTQQLLAGQAAMAQAAAQQQALINYQQQVQQQITQQQRESAAATLKATLSQWGLDSLGDKVWKWALNGKPPEQIVLDIRNTAEYKTRFPAMEQLGKEGRAISEAQYLDYEKGIKSLLQQYGFSTGVYDTPEAISKMLVSGSSLAEQSQRIQAAAMVAYQIPAEDRAFLQNQLGLGLGDIAMAWMDPDTALPVLEKKFAAAQLGGEAARAGIDLGGDQAARLTELGVTQGQARQGFDFMAQGQELFNPLAGQTGDVFDTDAQLGAVFGTDTQAAQKLKKRQRERTAVFEGGGGFTSSASGFTGIGVARGA